MPQPKAAPSLLQPIHLVDDLRHLGELITGGYSIFVPGLLLACTVALFVGTGSNIQSAGLPALAFNLFVFPPPLILSLAAGILSRRSSYLAGAIIGLAAGVFFSVYVMTAAFPPSSAGTLLTNDIRVQNAVYALVVSPVAGVLMGALGGFLRRLAKMLGAG